MPPPELRTPLANPPSTLEVAAAHPDRADLLLLARLDRAAPSSYRWRPGRG